MRISLRHLAGCWRVFACAFGLFVFSDIVAAEVSEIVNTIDGHLLRKMEAQGVEPVAPASDAEFLRRISLDLAGGIPSVACEGDR